MEIYRSARKHGASDDDIAHAVQHALVAAEDDTGKCLYLGPDLAGNLLEMISVLKEDGDEIMIHAMPMRPIYRTLLRDLGDADD